MKTKESYYNNVVKSGSMYLLFNSLTNSHLVLSEQLFDTMNKSKENFEELEQANNKLYNLLKENGFIVESE